MGINCSHRTRHRQHSCDRMICIGDSVKALTSDSLKCVAKTSSAMHVCGRAFTIQGSQCSHWRDSCDTSCVANISSENPPSDRRLLCTAAKDEKYVLVMCNGRLQRNESASHAARTLDLNGVRRSCDRTKLDERRSNSHHGYAHTRANALESATPAMRFSWCIRIPGI